MWPKPRSRCYALASLPFHSVDALKGITLRLLHPSPDTTLITARIIIRTIRITVIMAERTTTEIEPTDYLRFP